MYIHIMSLFKPSRGRKLRTNFVQDGEKCTGPYSLIQSQPAAPPMPPMILTPPTDLPSAEIDKSNQFEFPDYASSAALESSEPTGSAAEPLGSMESESHLLEVAEASGISKFDLTSWLVGASVFVVSLPGVKIALDKYKKQEESLEIMMKKYVVDKIEWKSQLVQKEQNLETLQDYNRRVLEKAESLNERLKKAIEEKNAAIGERDRSEKSYSLYKTDTLRNIKVFEEERVAVNQELKSKEEESVKLRNDIKVLEERVKAVDEALQSKEEEIVRLKIKINKLIGLVKNTQSTSRPSMQKTDVQSTRGTETQSTPPFKTKPLLI